MDTIAMVSTIDCIFVRHCLAWHTQLHQIIALEIGNLPHIVLDNPSPFWRCGDCLTRISTFCFRHTLCLILFIHVNWKRIEPINFQVYFHKHHRGKCLPIRETSFSLWAHNRWWGWSQSISNLPRHAWFLACWSLCPWLINHRGLQLHKAKRRGEVSLRRKGDRGSKQRSKQIRRLKQLPFLKLKKQTWNKRKNKTLQSISNTKLLDRALDLPAWSFTEEEASCNRKNNMQLALEESDAYLWTKQSGEDKMVYCFRFLLQFHSCTVSYLSQNGCTCHLGFLHLNTQY